MPSPTISETTMTTTTTTCLLKASPTQTSFIIKLSDQSSFYFPSFLVTLQSIHKNNLFKKHEPYIIPLLRVLQLRSSIYDHKTQYNLTSTSLPAPLHAHPLLLSLLSLSLSLSLSLLLTPLSPHRHIFPGIQRHISFTIFGFYVSSAWNTSSILQ